MFKSIVGFMLGKKILATIAGTILFVFIGVPLWLSSELDQIESVLRIAPMAENDRAGMLNLIHAIKEVR
jgi:hypothetical protein